MSSSSVSLSSCGRLQFTPFDNNNNSLLLLVLRLIAYIFIIISCCLVVFTPLLLGARCAPCFAFLSSLFYFFYFTFFCFGFLKSVCAACNVLAPRHFYQKLFFFPRSLSLFLFSYFSGIPRLPLLSPSTLLPRNVKGNIICSRLLSIYSCIPCKIWAPSSSTNNNRKKIIHFCVICHQIWMSGGTICGSLWQWQRATEGEKKHITPEIYEYRLLLLPLLFFFIHCRVVCLFDSNNYNNITSNWHHGFACTAYRRRRGFFG